MKDTIDGLDEMDDLEFGEDIFDAEGENMGGTLLRQIGEALGWALLIMIFVISVTCLTPPQKSAEADLFDAQANGEAPK